MSEKADRDRELWNAWRTDPNQDNTGTLLRGFESEIQRSVRSVMGAKNQGSDGIRLPEIAVRGQAQLLALKLFSKYDPDREKTSQPMTYLRGNLESNLRDWASQYKDVVRTPSGKKEHYGKIRQAERDLEDLLGRSPSHREVADHLQLGLNKVKILREHARTKEYIGGVTLGTITPGQETQTERAIDMAYDMLSPQDQRVYDLLQEGMDTPGIARKLRMTSNQVTAARGRIRDKYMYTRSRV